MCLRFVFLLITRLAAGLRLSRREEIWNTAEILILRHQLAILQRRQPRRPKLNQADRALLAALLSVIPKARRQRLRLLVTPETIVRWHRDILRRRCPPENDRAPAPAPPPAPAGPPGPGPAGPAGQRPAGTSRPWSADWPARTPNGDTAGSTASWPASGSRSPRPPSGRSSGPAASIPPGDRPRRPGHNSCAPRPRQSWPAISSRSTCSTAPRPTSWP